MRTFGVGAGYPAPESMEESAEGTAKGDNPAHHPVVAETVKGWRNQVPAPKQASALTAEALARIRETDFPRAAAGEDGWRRRPPALARATVDLAIIGVIADGGLRRSEAAALAWGDVEFWLDGTARLTIQKGKNQPDPATVALTETTARARRDAGQPDTCRSQSRRPGRRLHRPQRPHRHGTEDGGGRGPQHTHPQQRWTDSQKCLARCFGAR